MQKPPSSTEQSDCDAPGGTGGESTALPVAIHPNSEVISDAFGVLKLTLYADHYTWQFVPMQGQSFSDQGSGTCH